MSKVTPITKKQEEKESKLPLDKRADSYLKRSKVLKDWPEDEEEPRDMAWGKTNEDGGFVKDDDDET